LDDGCGEITTTAGGTAGFRCKLLQLSRLQQETCLVEDAPLGRLITPGTSLLLLVPKLQFLLLVLRGRWVRWETEQETATHWAKAAVVVTPSMAATAAGTKPPTTHMHIKQQEEKPNNKFFFTTTDKIAGIYLSISASISLNLSLSHSFLGLKTFFSIW
jgi:hypothetical protein